MTSTRRADPSPSPTARALSWSTLSATAKGSAHGPDAENQDAHAIREVTLSSGGRATVVAVADGHGGQRYIRSGEGARLAVAAALDVIEAALGDRQFGAKLESALRSATPVLVDRWRRDVLAHLASHPFSAADRARAGSDLTGSPTISYGATLIVAVARGAEVAVAQLGDGDVLVRLGGVDVVRPVPGDDRLVAGETTSLCLPDAAADFRFTSVSGTADCDLALVATDGYGNAFASPDWGAAVVSDLAAALHDSGPRHVGEHLPDWLEESAQVGGDDVTVVLLVRDPPSRAGDGQVARTVPSTGRPVPDPGEPATDASATRVASRRRRTVAFAMLLLVALLVLGGLLWLRHQSDAGPTSSSPSSPPRSTITLSHVIQDGART